MWPRLALGASGVLLTRVGRSFFSRLIFLLRQLWHEVMGSLFLVLSLGGASATLREWRKGTGIWILVSASFSLMMAYFGVTSFLSARRIRQQGAMRHP
jgi:hypothetical protein